MRRRGGSRVSSVPIDMSLEDFESAVDDAIDQIPDRLARAMNNVAIFVKEEFEPGPGEEADPDLLGLYEGTPLTERDSWCDAEDVREPRGTRG